MPHPILLCCAAKFCAVFSSKKTLTGNDSSTCFSSTSSFSRDSIVAVNWKALVPSVIGTLSLFFSLHVTLTCHYVTLTAPNGFSQNRGIWYMEGFERIGDSDEFRNVCTPYPAAVNMDAWWKTMRYLTLFGGIMGSISASFLWTCMFSPLTKRGWNGLASLCAFTTFLQGITFMFVKSGACENSDWIKQSKNRSCERSVGYSTDICATTLWSLTIIVMLVFPPHLKSEKEKQDPSEKQYDVEGTQAPEKPARHPSIAMPPSDIFLGGTQIAGTTLNVESVSDLAEYDKGSLSGSGSTGKSNVENQSHSHNSKKSNEDEAELLSRDDLPEVC